MEPTHNNEYTTLVYAAIIGVFLAAGRMLAAGERVTVMVALGRAVVNAGFAVAGFALLAVIPGLSIAAEIGVAALMASLGTTGVEMMAKRILGDKEPPRGS